MFEDCEIVLVGRTNWNDNVGREIICNYSVEPFPTMINEKYFCLSALSALWNYVEVVHNIYFLHHSVHFKLKGTEGTLMIGY